MVTAESAATASPAFRAWLLKNGVDVDNGFVGSADPDFDFKAKYEQFLNADQIAGNTVRAS